MSLFRALVRILIICHSNLQVRGHLAAKLDPLNIKVMDKEKADKLILRSMDIDMADSMDTVFQLPATTFIGGKVR